MSENITTIIITTISVLFGAGGWKFYEFLIRNKREKQKEDKSEQTIYRDDLIARVERLEKDKNEQTEELMKVKVEAAGLKMKVFPFCNYLKRIFFKTDLFKQSVNFQKHSNYITFTPLFCKCLKLQSN